MRFPVIFVHISLVNIDFSFFFLVIQMELEIKIAMFVHLVCLPLLLTSALI